MKIKIFLIALTSILILTCSPLAHASQDSQDNVTILALGDSLSAGTQDAATLAPTQISSWISIFAKQASVKFNVIFVNPWLDAQGERTNPAEHPTNISIPGLEIKEALTASGTIPLIDGVPVNISPYLEPLSGEGVSTPIDVLLYMLSQAKDNQSKRWVFVWLGANNAVFDFTRVSNLSEDNIDDYMTSPGEFEKDYQELMDVISAQAPEALFVITVPDILRVGFLFTMDDLAFFLGERIPKSNIDPNSLVPLNVAAQMIMGAQAGISSDILFGNLNPSEYLDSNEQKVIRDRLKTYNDIIRRIAAKAGATVIDTDDMISAWLMNGVSIGSGKKLYRSWGRGGIFSLDGIHPSDTGHALIANAAIARVNAALSIDIPEIDLATIYYNDPYRDLDGDGLVAGPTWKPKEGSIAAILRIFVDNDDTKFKAPPW